MKEKEVSISTKNFGTVKVKSSDISFGDKNTCSVAAEKFRFFTDDGELLCAKEEIFGIVNKEYKEVLPFNNRITKIVPVLNDQYFVSYQNYMGNCSTEHIKIDDNEVHCLNKWGITVSIQNNTALIGEQSFFPNYGLYDIEKACLKTGSYPYEVALVERNEDREELPYIMVSFYSDMEKRNECLRGYVNFNGEFISPLLRLNYCMDENLKYIDTSSDNFNLNDVVLREKEKTITDFSQRMKDTKSLKSKIYR